MRLQDYYTPTEKLAVIIPKSGFVRRARHGGHSPLILLNGCAGLGKTVYLAELAEDWGAPAVYVSIRPEDNDAEMLTAHLWRALVLAGGEDTIGDAEISAAQLAGQFVRVVSEGGFALLVDNIDRLTSADAIAVMERIVEPAACGHYRAAFAGRRAPEFLLRHIIGDTCLELTARELLFTMAETAENIRLQLPPDNAVLSIDSGLPISAAVESLHTFAGGWPAAETMILREIARSPGHELDLATAAERSHLRAFIDYHILRELDCGTADYMKRTAFLRQCGESLSRAVLHDAAAGEKLAYLSSRQLLVKPDNGADYPEYSPAVRQALSGMLSFDERRRLTEDAVSFYAADGRIAEAVSLLGESGDAETVERILSRFGGRLIENREFELIGYCAEIISRWHIPQDAEVLGVLAQYYYYSEQYDEMERALNAADSTFGKENTYSAYRGLYNGLLKYDKNPELYADIVRRSAAYLQKNHQRMPYLTSDGAEKLEAILHRASPADEMPLRVRRFGDFTVMLPDETTLAWRTKKAGEFMAYMLERCGRPVERDRLLDVLWRDNMPANPVAMLHNIIYSLRRELTAPTLSGFITYKDKCYALDLTLVRDADEDIFTACKAVAEGGISGLLPHQELFSTYWGKYLPGIDSEWVTELREHYDKLYVDGCLMLAAHAHDGGAFTRELALLKNAAAIDPYSERITREIIYCQIALGYPNKAKAKFDEYCALIDEELGIEPSKWLKKEFLACFSENRL
ncbi:MAG: hypothetical protein E7632_02035 [Ruminococcaceae bacterium]|nr:hypothetical protein [Oscillospiraceae bacterium]